ncbi:hypothetical protein [Streptomyces prasinus]|uniref:hypothetical protein n=1 Tax=Streptomyces prasinus TaxID=67345 RepID=UPI00146FDFD6|nr:hypothetical protein [Streptomyces prasinus]
MGLKAAARELGWPVGEMGNSARGAGRPGALHPMTVNEAVLALLRPKSDLACDAQLPKVVMRTRSTAARAKESSHGSGSMPHRAVTGTTIRLAASTSSQCIRGSGAGEPAAASVSPASTARR